MHQLILDSRAWRALTQYAQLSRCGSLSDTSTPAFGMSVHTCCMKESEHLVAEKQPRSRSFLNRHTCPSSAGCEPCSRMQAHACLHSQKSNQHFSKSPHFSA